MRWALAALVAAAGALTAHTVVNARALRRPTTPRSTVDEKVAVLLPVRDEAARVGPCVTALLAQEGVPGLEIVVLDDGSTDGTADLVRAAAGGDGRLRLVTGPPLPAGWLGKPHACAALAEEARDPATVLAFVDADVTLRPHAIAAAVTELRDAGSGCSPRTPDPRRHHRRTPRPAPAPVVLARRSCRCARWSARRDRRSPRPAASSSWSTGRPTSGPAATRPCATRCSKTSPWPARSSGPAAGSPSPTARGWPTVACTPRGASSPTGTAKSLWASFGSPAGATAVVGTLLVLYAVPPALAVAGAVAGDRTLAGAGAAAYLLGVAGRVVTARATGGRPWPDALAQPLSIVVFAGLVVRSFRRRRLVHWRGRPVTLP